MKVENILKLHDIKGKVIAFPTDTVFGVGCKIDDEESLDRIFLLKERDFNKPLAVLVGSLEDAIALVDYLPTKAVELIKKYWPGALTIICKKSSVVPTFLNKGYKTIGLRMPNSGIALSILRKFGPMAVTSVNISGKDALNTYEEIAEKFQNKIDFIIESDEESSSVSSTVIEITDDKIKVIRQGDIFVE